MGVIYKATCLISNRAYIGQTKRTLDKRRKEHEQMKGDYSFHKALKKYGLDNFVWEIIEECPDDQLDSREIYWVNYYNTYYEGYNSTKGGDNANSLDNWRQTHEKEVQQNALNGLKYAQQYRQKFPEEFSKQLTKAREKAIQSCSKKVCCVELNIIFNSLSEAERWSQTSQNPNGRRCAHQHISKVCSGKRKTAGGYTWKYIKEEE